MYAVHIFIKLPIINYSKITMYHAFKPLLACLVNNIQINKFLINNMRHVVKKIFEYKINFVTFVLVNF